MSGGVGPSGDINLQEDEHPLEKKAQNLVTSPDFNEKYTQKPRKAFLLSFRQLNCLAIMIILAASGMISIEEIGILIFTIIYVNFLNMITPSMKPHKQKPVFDPNSKILGLYISFAAIMGLFLPILYIFHGILEGDKDGMKSAAPHVFLLASQVFMEGVTASERFSLPIRVFVPVFFNGYRLLTLRVWLQNDFLNVGTSRTGGSSYVRLTIGRALAVANALLWFYNLFGFLIPVYIPRAFKMYFSNSGESNKEE